MQLDGMIQTKCQPEQVVKLLLAPEALRALMPEGCEVGEKAGDSVPFVLRRKVGPINLSMTGSLTLKPLPDTVGHELEVVGSHIVAGRFKMTLRLLPNSQAAKVKGLSWTGKMDAHGLSSRLLEGRTARVHSVIKSMFVNLRNQAERT